MVGGNALGIAPVIRCLALAVLPGQFLESHTTVAVQVTHPSIWATAAAIFPTLLLARILRTQNPTPEHLRYPYQRARALLTKAQQVTLQKTLENTKTLTDVGLEFRDESGTVMKGLGITVWASGECSWQSPTSERVG